ncbi:MAG: hypothetical protein ACRCRZ_01360 [Metamycoplasmataceae bacterium]
MLFNKNLESPIYNSFFGQSFFSWQGNKASFSESSWLFYLVLGLFLVAITTIVIFKTNLRIYFLQNTIKVQKKFQISGFIILFFLIFRIIILSIGAYPNSWELVPLHFCRFFISILTIFFITKKIEYIKYIGFFLINGAIFALLIPDLSNSEYWSEYGGADLGYDSYIFWDFLLIHSFSIFFVVLSFVFVNPKFSKNEIIFSFLSMIFLTFILFILDYSLSFVSDKSWRANWFYLSIDSVNGIDDILFPFIGGMARWPFIFITFILIGIFVYFLSLFIYIFFDKIEFYFTTNKNANQKIYLCKSITYQYFKDSKISFKKSILKRV